MVTDYFVIAHGESEVQVRAIADGIKDTLEELGVIARRREGWEDARWVLLDYGDTVAHIFLAEDREYYDLERLWGDAVRLRLSDDETALIPEERVFS